MNIDIAEIWLQYKQSALPEAKEKLVEYYLPFVRNIALGILRKLASGVELDDLVSDGIFGLLKAIEQFDPQRGVKFETYATTVVRGAIYNGLRSLDWVPERTREKTRALQKAMNHFTMIHGREGTESELAEELKISTAEVYDLITDLGCMYMLSLEQPFIHAHDDEGTILEVIQDENTLDPLIHLEFGEQREILRSVIESLPPRERELVTLYYFEGVSFEKIAGAFGISKQRVSQIHGRIIRNLREALAGWSGESAMFDRHSIFDQRV